MIHSLMDCSYIHNQLKITDLEETTQNILLPTSENFGLLSSESERFYKNGLNYHDIPDDFCLEIMEDKDDFDFTETSQPTVVFPLVKKKIEPPENSHVFKIFELKISEFGINRYSFSPTNKNVKIKGKVIDSIVERKTVIILKIHETSDKYIFFDLLTEYSNKSEDDFPKNSENDENTEIEEFKYFSIPEICIFTDIPSMEEISLNNRMKRSYHTLKHYLHEVDENGNINRCDLFVVGGVPYGLYLIKHNGKYKWMRTIKTTL